MKPASLSTNLRHLTTSPPTCNPALALLFARCRSKIPMRRRSLTHVWRVSHTSIVTVQLMRFRIVPNRCVAHSNVPSIFRARVCSRVGRVREPAESALSIREAEEGAKHDRRARPTSARERSYQFYPPDGTSNMRLAALPRVCRAFLSLHCKRLNHSAAPSPRPVERFIYMELVLEFRYRCRGTMPLCVCVCVCTIKNKTLRSLFYLSAPSLGRL